jgi:hypothetical protein
MPRQTAGGASAGFWASETCSCCADFAEAFNRSDIRPGLSASPAVLARALPEWLIQGRGAS